MTKYAFVMDESQLIFKISRRQSLEGEKIWRIYIELTLKVGTSAADGLLGHLNISDKVQQPERCGAQEGWYKKDPIIYKFMTICRYCSDN